MKIDLTIGTWQDNPGCPINITLVSTADVRALLDATKRHHQESIEANSCNRSSLAWFFCVFSSSTCTKRSQVDAKTPVFNRGITYQMKENSLLKVSIYFVGGA